MNKDDARFINKLISVKDSSPPEELLSRLSGECGRWQISICAVAFICVYIQSINTHLSNYLAPFPKNFTCADGNTSDPCVTVNGTKCHNFIFKKQHNMITFTEKFSLVCDRYYLVFWLNSNFIIGSIIGHVLVGIVADKCGRKVAALVFIPLQCLTGVLLAISITYEMACFARFMNALFSPSINLLTIISVCENVGNKWRTFALGFCLLPESLTVLTLYYIPSLFEDVKRIVAVISLSPLPLLILLLYFEDSPMYILLSSDYEKAEEAFRKIAHFNKKALSSEIRIRPVKLIRDSEDNNEKPTLSYFKYFRSRTTRNSFFALLWLWFCYGACASLLPDWPVAHVDLITFSLSWFILTVIIVVLCHWIQHKKIICAALFLVNICIFVMLLVKNYLIRDQHHRVNVVLDIISHCFSWTSLVGLEILTPRMLPTGLRVQGYGACLSIHAVGNFSFNVLSFFSQKTLSMWVSVPFLSVVGPISQTYCCLLLWNVHNRELPDFVEDCIQFKRYFKPQRYSIIKENRTTLQEIEVASIEFEDEEYSPR